jgi:tetratricopeptide (TPR) repeat protein
LGIREGAPLTRASVIKIAETLDAENIVHGAVSQPQPSELRFTVRLVDIPNMRQSAEINHSGALEDVAAIQNRIDWEILRQLRPESAPSHQEFLKSHPIYRIDAIESYVRGLMAPQADLKHRFFTQAARLDARYSRPLLALGRLLWEQENFKAAASWFAKIQPADSRYFEANFYLGLCRFYLGDYAGAQAAFEIVAQKVPLNEVLNNLGAAQSRRDNPQAAENFRRALEGDPSDPDYHFNLGYALWKAAKFEEAAECFRAALERDPEDREATLMLGRCLKRTRDPAAEPLERVKEEYNEIVFFQLKEALERKPK